MYYPYLRGKREELLALKELVLNNKLNEKIIPIIEPIDYSKTLNELLILFIKKNIKIIVVNSFNMINQQNQFEKEFSNLINNSNSIIWGIKIEKFIQIGVSKLINTKDYILISDCYDDINDYVTINWSNIKHPIACVVPNNFTFASKVIFPKIVLSDHFNKVIPNENYRKNDDEFFSDIHLCYKQKKFIGFSDYSIVGKEIPSGGTAAKVIAIHIVYEDRNGALRVKHCLSKKSKSSRDQAKKFYEANQELIKFNNSNIFTNTIGLNNFLNATKNPGLGMIKRWSLMHHIELIANI